MAGTTERRAPDGSFFRMPPFGLSTEGFAAEDAYAAVKYAIVRANYRLFHLEGDDAVLRAAGAALSEVFGDPTYGIRREDVFLIGSLWPTDAAPERVRAACQHALDLLRTKRFDLFVVSWPVALKTGHGRLPKPGTARCECCNLFMTDSIVPLADTWRSCEALVDAKLTRAIGLGNVAPAHVADVLDSCRIPPSALLVERTPYLPQRQLLDFCKEEGVVLAALHPLGPAEATPKAPRLLEEPAVTQAAGRAGVSPGLARRAPRNPPALPSRIPQALLVHARQTAPDSPLLLAARTQDEIRAAMRARTPPAFRNTYELNVPP
eukprot:tig00020801_g13978.t1